MPAVLAYGHNNIRLNHMMPEYVSSSCDLAVLRLFVTSVCVALLGVPLGVVPGKEGEHGGQ